MNIFSRLLSRSKTSKAIAKERLRLVLIHDRSGIPPELLNVLKNEIITVISKHVRVEREGIQIRLSHTQGLTKLEADIPIVSYRQSPTRTPKRSTTKPETLP